ncbi:MAG: HlyD family efflux transporter periplasmic adaptor subunit [Hyphomicrobiaceae bacterium]
MSTLESKANVAQNEPSTDPDRLSSGGAPKASDRQIMDQRTPQFPGPGGEPPPAEVTPHPRRHWALIALRGVVQLVLLVAAIALGLKVFGWLVATKPKVAKRPPQEKVFTVKAQPVVFASHRPRLRLYGSTVAGRQVEIRALVAGRVVETSAALKEGGTVEAGALLIVIDRFDYEGALTEAQAQLREARAKLVEFEAQIVQERATLSFARRQLTLARTDVGRAEPLSKRGAVSQKTVDDRRVIMLQREQAVEQSTNALNILQARAVQQRATIQRLEWGVTRARRRLDETRLLAPFNAFVADVGAQIGRMVNVNDRVATLIDKDWIEVRFVLTNQQYGRILAKDGTLVGRPVDVRWNVGDKPLTYAATIERTAARITSDTGGVEVFARIKTASSPVQLRPGAFVEVLVPDTEFADVARLPASAVYSARTVYVIEGGRLSQRTVEIVGLAEADVLVRGQIKAGEKVVTTRFSAPGAGLKVEER